VVRRLLDIISFSFTDFERQVSKSQADCAPPAFMVADWRLRKGSTVSFRNRYAVHERRITAGPALAQTFALALSVARI
jgi:hypothetical protein